MVKCESVSSFPLSLITYVASKFMLGLWSELILMEDFRSACSTASLSS